MLKNKQIIYKNIDDIIPYENNPRFNDSAVPKVAESIKQFGFQNPIIIDINNIIVAGHTRLKAARRLGLDVVPCIIADDLDPEQIKAYRLADNKVGEIAEWDFEALERELEGITDIDMGKFGFDLSTDDFDMEDLDKEETEGKTYVCNIRFDDSRSCEDFKNAIAETAESYGGRLSVKME